MYNILFTKSIKEERLEGILGKEYNITSEDFIQIDYIDIDLIHNQLTKQADFYVVSSHRAAQQIKHLNLNKPFYVVGERSKEILEKSGHRVAYCAPTAQTLLTHIADQPLSSKSFIFFCSNIRRDTLPKGLVKLGHKVQEVICYHTLPKQIILDKAFDAYVFLSPSGVKSFAHQYDIPKKASIFAIGTTTADAVTMELGLEPEIPEHPNLTSLLELIKTRLDAKK